MVSGDISSIGRVGADAKIVKFFSWNGEGKAPQISHWTSHGTVVIRACTPGKTVEVLFNGKMLGWDDIFLMIPVNNIRDGKYDRDAGVDLSEIIPSALEEWNDLS